MGSACEARGALALPPTVPSHRPQVSGEQLETLEERVSDCLNSLVLWGGGTQRFVSFRETFLGPHLPTHTDSHPIQHSVLDGQLQGSRAQPAHYRTLNNWKGPGTESEFNWCLLNE